MSYQKAVQEGLRDLDKLQIPGLYLSHQQKLKLFLTAFAEKIREGIVEEVEKMKKKAFDFPNSVLEPDYVDAYNGAIDDLLAQLKDK